MRSFLGCVRAKQNVDRHQGNRAKNIGMHMLPVSHLLSPVLPRFSSPSYEKQVKSEDLIKTAIKSLSFSTVREVYFTEMYSNKPGTGWFPQYKP